MKNLLLLLSSALSLLINCRFGDPASETRIWVPVTISPDADAMENTSCRVTVYADDMTIGPEESSDCRDIVVKVPEGNARRFHWERYTENGLLIDTGTTVIDVGMEIDTVSITLVAAIPLPRITTQPADRSVAEGGSVTFSVVAEGDGLTYQWRMGARDIVGATSNTFTMTMVDSAYDRSAVWCEVGNIAGSVTSDTAVLSVTREVDAPRITTQPVDRSVPEGRMVTLSVVAEGDGLSYQWQRESTNIMGATSNAYTIAIAALMYDNTTWRCIVTNQAGSDTSDAATLRVTSDTGTVAMNDTVSPVITILGGDTVRIPLGGIDQLDYYLKQVRAVDEGGGPVMMLDPQSDVNVFQVNTVPYRIVYAFSDTSMNRATALRYVFVYKPETVDATPPVITIGDPMVYVQTGQTYIDQGVTAWDNIDGSITQKITRTGVVNTVVEGSYLITYCVKDIAGNTACATRTVIVHQGVVIDTAGPVITLKGADTIFLAEDEKIVDYMQTYREPGYTAIDAEDGDLTGLVRVGSITQLNGKIWYIAYDVRDSDGNDAKTVKRLFKTTFSVVIASPIIDLEYPDSIFQLIVAASTGKAKWVEPGYTAADPVDGDITDKVIVDSSDLIVNLSMLGTYYVIYSVTNSSGLKTVVMRRVRIVDNPYDVIKPVITLLGQNPDTVLVNSATSYVDPGAIATDNRDGDITAKITRSGTVNMRTLGKYALTYIATDKASNRATVTRVVWVVRDTLTTDLLIRYDVPSENPLPDMENKVYVNVQVDGEGPVLSNIAKMSFSWSLANKSLYNFQLNSNKEPWNKDLIRISQTFASAYPEMTLTNTGIAGLDGKYYVATLDDEFYWVERSGRFAIIWSE